MKALLAVAAVLFVASGALASTVDVMSLEDLQDRSALIVHGSVVDVALRDEGGTAFTDAEIQVRDCLSGLCREAVVVTSEGLEGAPQFRAGDEVVVFLRPQGQDLVVVGMAQGCFRVERSSAGAVAVSDRSGLDMVETTGRPSLVDRVAYPLEELVDAVRLGTPASPLAQAN